MKSELIENNLKDSEEIGFDFDRGSVDLNLTECKTIVVRQIVYQSLILKL